MLINAQPAFDSLVAFPALQTLPLAVFGPWFERGGPVMWPLLLLSILALGVIFERAFFWMSERRHSTDEAFAGARDLNTVLVTEERRMARGMNWLDTTITAAPLLGILGTVLGIIEAFELLSARAAPDPLEVSGGVARALITTATGLVVALVVIFPFNWFRGRIRARLAELEATARTLLERSESADDGGEASA